MFPTYDIVFIVIIDRILDFKFVNTSFMHLISFGRIILSWYKFKIFQTFMFIFSNFAVGCVMDGGTEKSSPSTRQDGPDVSFKVYLRSLSLGKGQSSEGNVIIST